MYRQERNNLVELNWWNLGQTKNIELPRVNQDAKEVDVNLVWLLTQGLPKKQQLLRVLGIPPGHRDLTRIPMSSSNQEFNHLIQTWSQEPGPWPLPKLHGLVIIRFVACWVSACVIYSLCRGLHLLAYFLVNIISRFGVLSSNESICKFGFQHFLFRSRVYERGGDR